MNKAVRLLKNMEEKDVEKIQSAVGCIDENATPLKQAKFIDRVLCSAENMKIDMTDPLRKCGSCCISANAIRIAKRLYRSSNSLEEFLRSLNEADIGGKKLHMEDGKIIAIYQKCYCNLPKKIDGMNPVYCECSAGWYKKLFSEAFEKEVDVQIVNTILSGASECKFVIAIKE